ncbi:MAG: NAD(P)H-binding protein [Solirubrobacteraceae bacterium]|nr:NAD(P)H-binding protein [Solirubrobacteraceae bacterium]
MARFLIVGGGCRGLRLARALRAEGHAARVTTRDPGRRSAIAAAGAEAVVADPDRIGTLRDALDGVTVLLWLLGTVDDEALHGPRWRMMLERTIDTTVRGVVYERGTDAGAALTRELATFNGIPHAVVDARAADWLGETRAAIARLL